jgi:lauroyl/myristoyl acyltransferase
MTSATVWGLRAGSLAARLLPAGATPAVSRLLGELAARQPTASGTARRRLVQRHLQRVSREALTPRQLTKLSDQAFASYARYWIESLRLPHLSPSTVLGGLHVDRVDRLEAGLGRGKGVIVALPHLGGWEWGGAWMAYRGYPTVVVVEALEPQVFEWFAGLRRALGMEIIAADRHAAGAVLAALRANKVVYLLSDRAVKGVSGVEVEFFGEKTLIPAGPAAFALRSGAPVIPAAVYFGEHGTHNAVVRPPLEAVRSGRLRLDIEMMTQALAAELEVLITAAPAQWHLMQPNWPSDRL